MSRTWLSIRVDLIGGGGQDLWPRPGRILAASRSHTFAQLATAIDDAFARWDRAHLHQFDLADGVRIGRPDRDDENEDVLDGRRITLARLKNDEQFVYEFDFGDSWEHLCAVGPLASTPSSSSAYSLTGLCPIGAGESSRTSMTGDGTATKAKKKATPDRTPNEPISHRCAPCGGPRPRR